MARLYATKKGSERRFYGMPRITPHGSGALSCRSGGIASGNSRTVHHPGQGIASGRLQIIRVLCKAIHLNVWTDLMGTNMAHVAGVQAEQAAPLLPLGILDDSLLSHTSSSASAAPLLLPLCQDPGRNEKHKCGNFKYDQQDQHPALQRIRSNFLKNFHAALLIRTYTGRERPCSAVCSQNNRPGTS